MYRLRTNNTNRKYLRPRSVSVQLVISADLRYAYFLCAPSFFLLCIFFIKRRYPLQEETPLRCLVNLPYLPIANLRTPSAQPALPSHTQKVADIAQQVRLILHTLHNSQSHIQLPDLHVFNLGVATRRITSQSHRIAALTHARQPTDKPLRPRKWLASTIALP